MDNRKYSHVGRIGLTIFDEKARNKEDWPTLAHFCCAFINDSLARGDKFNPNASAPTEATRRLSKILPEADFPEFHRLYNSWAVPVELDDDFDVMNDEVNTAIEKYRLARKKNDRPMHDIQITYLYNPPVGQPSLSTEGQIYPEPAKSTTCTCVKKTTTDGLGYSDASNCEMHKGQFDEINKLHEALFVYMRRHGVVRATVFIPEEATKAEEVQIRLYRKE